MNIPDVDQIELLSVGIDVGSSTSHLVFSELTLTKDPTSSSKRFQVKDRNVVFEGEIIDTPLIDPKTIDIENLIKFFSGQYKAAGYDPEDVDTGAVIVTGETAKKENASDIIDALSEDAGKFVSATAGPNFESILAAMGSGATQRSMEHNNVILSCDIGGGTSNIALNINGEVKSTACVSVGGRLIGIDKDNKIWRIDEPGKQVLQHLDLNYDLGDKIPNTDLIKIANTFVDVLFEVITGPVTSTLAKELMMTTDLKFDNPINEISLSGGVSDILFGEPDYFNDIGRFIAQAIEERKNELDIPVIEPTNKIRATVIGAGAYSLSISGSTSYLDQSFGLPIKNLPVLRVDIDRKKLSMDHIQSMVEESFTRFDISQGEQMVALYFKDPVRAAYNRIKLFAKGLAASIDTYIKHNLPVILVFQRDIGNSIGNVIKRETEIDGNLLAIDELTLKEGDWIDIGSPLVNDQVFPVTVKSLVFDN